MKNKMARRSQAPQADLPADPNHRRRCSVCSHPDRAAIEEAFLDWENVSQLTREYGLPGRTAIYRHARAIGLDRKREGNMRVALERIIEKASTATATADAVVRAVELYARLFPPRISNVEAAKPIATPSNRT